MPDPVSSSVAREGARRLFEILDQSKTVRRPFDDEDREDTLPPDGVLDRGELPIRAFDRLALVDRRVTPAELEAAIAKLSPSAQADLVDAAGKTRGTLEAKGKRFMGAFAAFGLGGVALMGGLLLGGPFALAGIALGAVGILGGFGTAVATIGSAGRATKALVDTLDQRLGA